MMNIKIFKIVSFLLLVMILLTGCNQNKEEQPQGEAETNQTAPEGTGEQTPATPQGGEQAQQPSQGDDGNGIGIDENWDNSTPAVDAPETQEPSNPDEPVSSDPEEPDSTEPSEPEADQPVEEPGEEDPEPDSTEEPSSDEEADPNDPVASMTYEKYLAMTATEKMAFKNAYFATSEEFNAWYNKLKADYQAQQGGITVEGGSINLGDYIK